MSIQSVEVAAPATKEEWALLGNLVKRGKTKGVEDLGWRVLKPSEGLPKGSIPVHGLRIGDSEFVIVKLPSL